MAQINRRDFLKYTSLGLSAIVVGNRIPWLSGEAQAVVPALNITITEAIKEMTTHNAINTAECYFWVYKEAIYNAEVPACTIIVTQGDTIPITITNTLDEPHALYIPGMFDSGPIAPGATLTTTFVASEAGSFLYYDNLNEPVNRVMGLHGAFIVMPSAPSGTKWTPYANPTPQVQRLFDELGEETVNGQPGHWPGLAWEEGDPATLTPPFRQYVWICSQASAALFRDVGRLASGVQMDPAVFVERFTRDAFSNNSHDIDAASDIPQYFMITGQSGHMCHNNPVITPMARVGEPVVVRIMNAGLMAHSMHLHCNHYYILSVDGVIQGTPVGNAADNPTLLNPGVIWVDTFTLNPPPDPFRPYSPSSRYDMLIPFMRAPDVPNERGIGRGGSGDAALTGVNGQPVWPPVEEFDVFIPDSGDIISCIDGTTVIPGGLKQRESPLCYPMHDHSEPSQTTQGGNYNTALISGMYIIGDRNITLPRYNIDDLAANPGANADMPQLPPQTFPMDMDFAMMLGLHQTPQYCTYGINHAQATGMQESSKDSENVSQKDREDFPAVPVA